jgi:hypothetical protein
MSFCNRTWCNPKLAPKLTLELVPDLVSKPVNRTWRNPKLAPELVPDLASELVPKPDNRTWRNPKLAPVSAPDHTHMPVSVPVPVPMPYFEFNIDKQGEEVIHRTYHNPNLAPAVGSKRLRYWDKDNDDLEVPPKIARGTTSVFEEKDFIPTPL